jgi:hypothetical protein
MFVAEAQPVHNPGSEILDDDVGLVDERQNDLATFGRFEVDGEEPFVPKRAKIEPADTARHFRPRPAA